jgi:hypothetical protein
MKNSNTSQNTANNSAQSRSRHKSLSSINPCDRDFNFDLWANLVREQMQTVLHRNS